MAIEPIEEGDLLITVAGEQAGGQTGQLIINDVSFSADREVTNYSGVGNDEAVASSTGNPDYTLDFENILNEASAEVLKALIDEDATPEQCEIVDTDTDVLRISIGVVQWNSWEFSASDDGDVTVSITATCRDVDVQ